MTGLGLAAVLALSPEQRDLLPLPRYVDPDQISAVVAGAVPAWQQCAAEAPGARVALRLSFGRNGKVTDATVTVPDSDPPTPPAAEACWLEVARTLDVGPGDEDVLVVSLRLAVVGGVVVAPQSVDLRPRSLDPLFLYIPPDTTAEQRAEMLRALGLDESAAEPRGSTLPQTQPAR